MYSEQAEKEFEEWWKKIPANNLYHSKELLRISYLEAHSRQQKEIDRLREWIKRIIQFPLLDDDAQHITAMWRELQKLLEEGKDE